MSSRRLINILGLALAYYVTGYFGLTMALPPGFVTPVWPPSGIALAVVFIAGNYILPGVFLGSFFINVHLFNTLNQEAILTCSGIALGATLQAYVGAYLMKQFTSSQPLSSAFNVFKFILIGAGSCLINATIRLLTLDIVHELNRPITWWTWWIGDTVSVLIFTPLILSWYQHREERITFLRLLEKGLIFFILFILVKMNSHLPYS